MNEKLRAAIKELGPHFASFARNGRWGTCAGCPRDSNNVAYPEFCHYTTRYDHQLTAAQLSDAWNREIQTERSFH